ncbi:short-chain fatty acyl-CoA regulator family protein [Rhodobacter capsulatus]|uniref:short-chain fatty acyl-CoA regulator family protein n=1 Tax=Rhodobacter capsulatus TaxID=1061 RepID=UPI00402594DC
MARSALTGTRIRERRLTLKLRQADLARAVGISAAYLNLIEHNRRRVSEPLLDTFAKALGVAPVALSEGAESALFEALREAAAGVAGGAGTGTGDAVGALIDPSELERIEEFVGRFPGWAKVLAARQSRLAALERVVETYSERMGQDPYLLDELHEVLSAVTSLRSSAAILVETPDIEPEWQARFLSSIASESLRLSAAAEGLVAYLDSIEATDSGLAAPLDQLEAWLSARGWHLPDFERPDPPDPAELIAQAPELAASAARDLALSYLTRALADSRILPLKPFLAALSETGLDPARLAARFGAPMAAVFRRLATLPEGAANLPPLGLVVCDGSGTLTLRRPLPGFALPRSAAGCPLWPLYEALSRPMQPLRLTLDMAGRLPQRFQSWAFAAPRPPEGAAASFDAPVLMEAMMLVTPATSRLETARPVGTSCRVCPRLACAGRREPSLIAAR